MILAMGRLVPQKDYPTLLTAFAKLKGTPVLLVLGEGPLRSELEEQARALRIADRVHLVGFRSQPDEYLAYADLFVLASRFEGFPNVLTEALALGRTAVATDAPGGAGEILEGGQYGYLTPVGNAEALAEALQHGLDEPIQAAVARGRAEQFAVENVAGLYEGLFATAISRRRQAFGMR
ncbi:glycosyltransferase [Sphingobium yanoikuyae]|nr:glycosyltransferase [Sphingobium yanoikuyae]